MAKKNIRNIALFAHVDAGKTTISEQFLFQSGKIKSLGSVDKGSSQTDFLDVEKERGITVNSTVLTFYWKETQINLIDTPGHIDFSSETEKSINAIDSAVIIISALEGVQAQTENIINLLLKNQKPFIIFIISLIIASLSTYFRWIILIIQQAGITTLDEALAYFQINPMSYVLDAIKTGIDYAIPMFLSVYIAWLLSATLA